MQNNKREDVVWYDLETTGLDYRTHGVIEVAMLFEKNGEVVETLVTKVNCADYARDVAVDPKALEINKTKQEEIEKFPALKEVLQNITRKLYKVYGNKKVKLVGFNNTSFDKWFLEEMFTQGGDAFDKYFHYKQIDVFEIVKGLHYMQILPRTFNQRLVTIVEEYKLATVSEIEENAHNALWDIYMTKNLLTYIEEKLRENN